MRLNKHISDTGFCSRREADRLIAEGRVTVNGIRARVGAEVGEGDEVLVDGQPLRARAAAAPGKRRHVYIALNKPVGITCTTEDGRQGQHRRFRRPPGADLPDRAPRQGFRRPDPADQQRRHRQRDPARREQAGEGIPGRDQPRGHRRIPARHGPRACRSTARLTLPCKTGKLGRFGFRIVLVQGLNRQIRLMAAHFGHRVKQLLRVRIGTVKLGHLKPGQWRNLTDAELRGTVAAPERVVRPTLVVRRSPGLLNRPPFTLRRESRLWCAHCLKPGSRYIVPRCGRSRAAIRYIVRSLPLARQSRIRVLRAVHQSIVFKE